MLATELAITHPQLVRRMILMGIPYYDAAGRQERLNRLGRVKPWLDSFAAVAQDWIFAVEERAPLLTQPTLVLNPHGNLQEPFRAYAELINGAMLIELPGLKYGIFDAAPYVPASHARPFLNRR